MDASIGASVVRPYVFPSVLNKVYSISDNSAKGHGSQGVYETGGQNYSPKDLAQFQKNYSLPITPIAVNIGGNNDSETCVIQSYKCSEANLDTQFITAVAQDLPTWFWSVNKVMRILSVGNVHGGSIHGVRMHSMRRYMAGGYVA
jgi:hypothetical protein